MGAPSVDYEKLLEMRNTKNRFTKKLGIAVTALSAGYAKVEKTVEEDDLNPLGRPHGGLYFTMADNAAGSAMSARGYVAVTMDASYHFFRAASAGDHLTAEAREVKGGRTICVYEVRITDQRGALLGMGTFTFFQMEEKLSL